MKLCAALAALALSTAALGALPGVTELRSPPGALTDAELSSLLDARVASAHVIAIGETVHGSSALLDVQARLVRFLVERHGVRLVVWETASLRSLEMTRWLSSCTTAVTPPPVDVLYFPTTSDVPLFEWLCQRNRRHPHDVVVFRGMDVWDRPWEHYARIESLGAAVAIDGAPLASIRTSCPGYGRTSWADLEALYGDVQRDGRFVPEAAYRRCTAALSAVLNAARASGLEKKKMRDPGSDDAFELALSASTLLGWLGFYDASASDDVASWNERDRAQGRNLMLLMEKHGATRAVVSAHTSHVSHNRSPADWWGYGDLKSGVHFFEQLTGKSVFSLALTAYQASGAQGEWLLPTARNSMDRTLHDAGHAFAFFHADAPFLAAHRRWWMQNNNAEPFANGVELVPADHFDAYFFFARSLLERALPARDVWQP